MQLAKLNGKAEIFYTLQGEGRSLGMPAIFVRLARCNLSCYWCDTPYTWNWNGTKFEHEDNLKFEKSDEIVELDSAGVAELITQFDCKRVVITGGEPLLQQSAIAEVCELLGEGYIVEIETNGTITPSEELDKMVGLYNVSPKLSSSRNNPNRAIKPEVLSWFAQTSRTAFKFVISNPTDLYEVLGLMEQININPSQVYLMPEGRTADAIYQGGQALADICKEIGTNFTTRLHVLLWGAKKGV